MQTEINVAIKYVFGVSQVALSFMDVAKQYSLPAVKRFS